MTPHVWIAPSLGGPPTGGTLFNRELVLALGAAGWPIEAVELDAGRARLAQGAPGTYWLDSLFLAHFPALHAAKARGQRLGLICHYLPTLVARGDGATRGELEPAERAALDESDVILTTSAQMSDTLRRLASTPPPTLVVEPGRWAKGPGVAPSVPAGVVGRLVANVTPGKGVLPLLQALAAVLEVGEPFTLEILGSLEAAPEYAAACERVVRGAVPLRERVSFAGALAPEAVVERLAAGNLLVSASATESYGMALAEARTLGLPIVACGGGNVRGHLSPSTGGELVDGPTTLAAASVRLCRDPATHANRWRRAWAHALPPRSWAAAAGDFATRFEALALERSAHRPVPGADTTSGTPGRRKR